MWYELGVLRVCYLYSIIIKFVKLKNENMVLLRIEFVRYITRIP